MHLWLKFTLHPARLAFDVFLSVPGRILGARASRGHSRRLAGPTDLMNFLRVLTAWQTVLCRVADARARCASGAAAQPSTLLPGTPPRGHEGQGILVLPYVYESLLAMSLLK